MKCDSCDYFVGREYDTGCPECKPPNDECPYGQELEKNGSEALVKVSLVDLDRRVASVFQDTIEAQVVKSIDRIVQEKFKNIVADKAEELISQKIEVMVSEYMAGDIVVSQGWSGSTETKPRNEFLADTITQKLDNDFPKDKLQREITASVESQINKFTSGLKTSIDRQIKSTLDESMRQNMTDAVVNVLMANETYQRLSGSMGKLIEGGK